MATMRGGGVRICSVVLLGAEALGVLALAIWQIVAVVMDDVLDVVSAVALIVFTVVAAVVVGAFAVGVSAEQSWGRSGGIVVQLMILAVALGAATGSYAHPAIAAALAAPALVTLGLLIVLARRSNARRRDVDGIDAN